jgi:hypothetical protein
VPIVDSVVLVAIVIMAVMADTQSGLGMLELYSVLAVLAVKRSVVVIGQGDFLSAEHVLEHELAGR